MPCLVDHSGRVRAFEQPDNCFTVSKRVEFAFDLGRFLLALVVLVKNFNGLVVEYNKTETQCPLRLPDLLMVITGGEYAYTRDDGVVVCPISALRP